MLHHRAVSFARRSNEIAYLGSCKRKKMYKSTPANKYPSNLNTGANPAHYSKAKLTFRLLPGGSKGPILGGASVAGGRSCLVDLNLHLQQGVSRQEMGKRYYYLLLLGMDRQ